MKKIPHPIQYQGSKRNLANVILRYFPTDICCLIEPFAGSAAISIASAASHKTNQFIINDYNKPLADLLELIVQKPIETASQYEEIWSGQHESSIEHFYKIRDEFNRDKNPVHLLYLMSRCIKGAIRYNSDGQLNQSPDKRRLGTRPEKMRSNIIGVSNLLKDKVKFYSLDYREIVKKAKPVDLVYMDPPYQGVCGNKDSRYFSGINHDDFVVALEELNTRKIPYIVSYDGRRGDKVFGEVLPSLLSLTHLELDAGRSSQSTLLGLNEVTYESLYLSPSLIDRLDTKIFDYKKTEPKQYMLLEPLVQYV